MQFAPAAAARGLARRCNDYAAELCARWPRRFGAFALVPMQDIDDAVAEIVIACDTLGFAGVCLFASYGEKFLGDARFDPVLDALNARDAVVFVHPAYHPSSRSLDLPWPGFMMEYLFDTTRAAANLLLSGAIERFPRIRFILAHAGGVLPYFAWRLSVAPMVDPRLPQWPREKIFAGLRPLLVRHRAVAGHRRRWRARPHRRARAHPLRQRLALHNQNSMTAGPRGPVLLQDYQLIEKLAHQNRERIPERPVHAKGWGAFGTLTITGDISQVHQGEGVCKPGAKTDMLARFSTVAGELGAADAERDVRGFALKFYTEEGNWDLVGNNTPVFFVRDPLQVPRLHPHPEAPSQDQHALADRDVGFLVAVAGEPAPGDDPDVGPRPADRPCAT